MASADKPSHWVAFVVSAFTAVTVACGAIFWVSDAHNDGRYVQKTENAAVVAQVEKIAADVVKLSTVQAVNTNKIENIQKSTDELKQGQDTINNKLDRLIERR